MATELTNLKGIGATAASSLSDAGFTTIEEVANATPEALSKAHGFGPARAVKVIDSAKELSGSSEPVSVPETPVVTEEKKVEVKAEEKVEAKSTDELDRIAYTKSEPKVAPVVAAKGAGKSSSFSGSQFIFTTIMVIGLIWFAIVLIKPELIDKIYSTVNTGVTTLFTVPEQADDVTVAANDVATADQANESSTAQEQMAQGSMDQNQMNQSQAPQWFVDQHKAGIEQPVEPEWITKRRSETEKYRADMQQRMANGQPPVEPEWITKRRAETKKYQADMQQRMANGQPPVEPEWITKRRAETEKYQAELEKRYETRERPAEPEWAAKRRADSEKYRADMQQRMANGQPPVEPEWVTQRRAESDKYRAERQNRSPSGQQRVEPVWLKNRRAEAQKRYEDAVRQREAYFASRGYRMPPQTRPYNGPYPYPRG